MQDTLPGDSAVSPAADLTQYPTDDEMVADWTRGQQRAQLLAWQLHIRPASLMDATAPSPPPAVAGSDRWYLQPWLEEQEALQKMSHAAAGEVDDTPTAQDLVSGARTASAPAASAAAAPTQRKR
jgi:hypothetical protein